MGASFCLDDGDAGLRVVLGGNGEGGFLIGPEKQHSGCRDADNGEVLTFKSFNIDPDKSGNVARTDALPDIRLVFQEELRDV